MLLVRLLVCPDCLLVVSVVLVHSVTVVVLYSVLPVLLELNSHVLVLVHVNYVQCQHSLLSMDQLNVRLVRQANSQLKTEV